MEFNDFIETIKCEIPRYLTEYNIDRISVREITKNNNVTCTGMAIILKGEHMAPNMYLDYFYDCYKNGAELDDVLSAIAHDYTVARASMVKSDIELPGENMWDRIFIRVVNYEANKEILQECPYVMLNDLALTYRFLARNDEDGIASLLLTWKYLEAFGIKDEDLYELAKENTRRLFPPLLKTMYEIVMDKTGECYEAGIPMYVLSNTRFLNGATSIIFNEYLKQFADKMESDIYVLPSSIHEVILVPANIENSKEELKEIVKEANKASVYDIDYLSDSIYIYNRETGILSM